MYVSHSVILYECFLLCLFITAIFSGRKKMRDKFSRDFFHVFNLERRKALCRKDFRKVIWAINVGVSFLIKVKRYPISVLSNAARNDVRIYETF